MIFDFMCAISLDFPLRVPASVIIRGILFSTASLAEAVHAHGPDNALAIRHPPAIGSRSALATRHLRAITLLAGTAVSINESALPSRSAMRAGSTARATAAGATRIRTRTRVRSGGEPGVKPKGYLRENRFEHDMDIPPRQAARC